MKHSLTMSALARLTSLTTSYVSQVERNRITPSIPAIQKIAHALNTSVSAFFDETDTSRRLVRAANRRRIEFPREGVIDYLLSPSLSGRLQVLLTEAPPGTGSLEYYSHESDEECVFLLAGKIRFWIDKEVYDLEEGDALTFPSRVRHRWKNTSKKVARVLWAMTPPSY